MANRFPQLIVVLVVCVLALNPQLNYSSARSINEQSVQVTGTSTPAPTRYFLTDLGTLYGGRSFAMDINNRGLVVGDSKGPTSSNEHAFIYNGVMRDLAPAFIEDHATGINDFGDIVGYGDIADVRAQDHAILWSSGLMQDLGTLCPDPPDPAPSFCNAGSQGRAYGINALRQVVGYAMSPEGFRAFLWTPGGNGGPESNPQMRDLGTLGGSQSMAKAINNAGQVVGWSLYPGDTVAHPFLFSGGAMRDLGTLGGNDNQLFGGPSISINNSGQVAGMSQTAGGAYHAFLYNGGMQDLGTLGGRDSGATDINDAGQVVGADSQFGPFLYSNGVMQRLTDLVSNIADWALQDVRAINNAGQIVGYASSLTGGVHAVLLTPEDLLNCPLSISPASQIFNASGASDKVKVTAPAKCTWTAVSNVSWITVNAFDGVGTGHVRYSVSATTSSRTGTMTIARRTFTVVQNGPAITIWLNAYIPRDLFWLTLPVPNSSSGETMIPGPLVLPLSECFLTDQRNASVSLNASSRMHSQTTINLTSLTKVDSHRADPTIAVNGFTGAEQGRLTADTSRMQFTNLMVSPDQKTITFTLRGAASNPFFPLDPIPLRPDIRYEIRIEVKINRGTLHVDAQGFCTIFPAVEMYAALDGGTAKPLFQEGPVPFSTPVDLVRPDAIRPVSGRVVFQTQ